MAFRQSKGATIGIIKTGETVQQKFDNLDASIRNIVSSISASGGGSISGAEKVWYYTATGGEDSFVVSFTGAFGSIPCIYINGIRQEPVTNFTYTTSNKTISLLGSKLNTDDVVTVVMLEDATPIAKSVTFTTPEAYGAKADGTTDDTQAFVKAFASGVKTVVANGSYVISSKIAIPAGVHFTGSGVIKQNQAGSFTWTINNLVSTFSMFLINTADVKVSYLTFIPQFEALHIDTGSSNVLLSHLTINNPAGTKGSGIAAWNSDSIRIEDCDVHNCGHMGSYDATNTTKPHTYGICNGIHLGCHNAIISRNRTNGNGYCGIFAYGCKNLTLTNNTQLSNGGSGIQYSPSVPTGSSTADPTFGINITGNYAAYNYADGIDINWTGTSAIPMNGSITGCTSYLNGFFQADITKPTQDGGGCTLRMVTDYNVSGCSFLRNGGGSVYMSNPERVVVSGCTITNPNTEVAGISVMYSAHDVTISNNIVITKGSSLILSGGANYERLRILNNTLESTNGTSLSAPATTYKDCAISGNHHTTANQVQYYFGASDERVRYTGDATKHGVYVKGSFSTLSNIIVDGTSSDSLFYVDGGSYNRFISVNANNLGSGPGFEIENATYSTVIGCSFQSATGSGATYTGGNQITSIDVTYTGATSVTSGADHLYYVGNNRWAGTPGTQTYTVKPYDITYNQRP